MEDLSLMTAEEASEFEKKYGKAEAVKLVNKVLNMGLTKLLATKDTSSEEYRFVSYFVKEIKKVINE